MSRPQRGLILPALLVVLIIGGLATVLGQAQLGEAAQFRRQQSTLRALAEARAALIGYAQTYHHTHPDSTIGFLPCPDLDLASGDGNAEGSCGATGVFSVGRLPYRTLGLSPLRDGYGECLWYAVAGTFKNRFPAGYVTWDTLGQFTLALADGTVLNPGGGRQRAVAVIFSPGPPTATQQRGTPTHRCSGNADALVALSAYLEDALVPQSAPYTLTPGTPGSEVGNDTLVWISAEDVFSDALIETRSDFDAFIHTMLTTLDAALSTHPDPVPQPYPVQGQSLPPNVDAGTLPAGDASPEGLVFARYAAWGDQFRYFRCTDLTRCLWVDLGAGPDDCARVLLFAGRAQSTQDRVAAPSAPSAYFEGANVVAVADPSQTFSGATAYNGATADRDLVRCIK